MPEKCVCCDSTIPEGRQVCPVCEHRIQPATQQLRICFEIDGIAEDERGNPAPAGASMTIELIDNQETIDYTTLIENVNVPGLLAAMCLDGIVKPEAVRFITPEEYAAKYGED